MSIRGTPKEVQYGSMSKWRYKEGVGTDGCEEGEENNKSDLSMCYLFPYSCGEFGCQIHSQNGKSESDLTFYEDVHVGKNFSYFIKYLSKLSANAIGFLNIK